MCTTAAKTINSSWFLIKTRDPVEWMRWDDEIKLFDTKDDKLRKYLIQNPNPHEDGFYGGINEKGVAFVSTFVNVAENQVSYIRRPYVRLILDANSAKEAVSIIESFNPKIGGNMFVADEHECYGIEGAPDQYYIEKITNPSVKTNHYLHLPYKNRSFDSSPSYEKWSKTHQARAEEMIANANSVEDLENILKDRKNAEEGNAICTTSKEDECFTHSAFIFDTKNKVAYYCQGNPVEKPFIKYEFPA
jgi:predicted choloylglycine hydrolase